MWIGPSGRRGASTSAGFLRRRSSCCDWPERFHLVALGRPEEGVVEEFRVEHTRRRTWPGASGGSRRCPLARATGLDVAHHSLEADPGKVRLVLENGHGALVEALLAAGYVVLPVNPDLVAGWRGLARAKDDAADAPHLLPGGS